MPYQTTTSGAAYKEVLPTISDKQRKVLEAIQELNKYQAVNDQQIAKHLGWEINRITPRRKELVDKGLVVKFCEAKYPNTGKKTAFWKVAQKQLNLF